VFISSTISGHPLQGIEPVTGYMLQSNTTQNLCSSCEVLYVYDMFRSNLDHHHLHQILT